MKTIAEIAELFAPKKILGWLETQDSSKKYVYVNHTDCLLTRYAKSVEIDEAAIKSDHIIASDGKFSYGNFDEYLNYIAQGRSTEEEDVLARWTYGAAAERCRRVIMPKGD
jgi:hypothetical protein